MIGVSSGAVTSFAAKISDQMVHADSGRGHCGDSKQIIILLFYNVNLSFIHRIMLEIQIVCSHLMASGSDWFQNAFYVIKSNIILHIIILVMHGSIPNMEEVNYDKIFQF